PVDDARIDDLKRGHGCAPGGLTSLFGVDSMAPIRRCQRGCPPGSGRTEMTDLGIGIIGSGYMARTFAECLRQHTRGGRLRAIAGGTRAPATAAEFGVAAVASVDELVARPDVDAVIVTTPHANHRHHVIAAA